jgi:hypothetical protein
MPNVCGQNESKSAGQKAERPLLRRGEAVNIRLDVSGRALPALSWDT